MVEAGWKVEGLCSVTPAAVTVHWGSLDTWHPNRSHRIFRVYNEFVVILSFTVNFIHKYCSPFEMEAKEAV